MCEFQLFLGLIDFVSKLISKCLTLLITNQFTFYNIKKQICSMEKMQIQADEYVGQLNEEIENLHLDQTVGKVQKKKSKILIRKIKKVPLLLNCGFVFKVSQSLIINERALKDPKNCPESFFTSIFYFKTIKSLRINESVVELSLKQTQHNQFDLQYYLQRFRSFGNQQFYNFANTVEAINKEIAKMCANVSRISKYIGNQQKLLLEKILNQVLESKKGKRFICFYYEPSKNSISMNKIFISKELLIELGYDVNQICDDFLKYRHVFFEIFDATLYYQIVSSTGQNLARILKKKNDNLSISSQNLPKNDNQMKFTDFVFRKLKNEKGTYQQKVKADILFYKTHANISFIEIQKIDQNSVIEYYPKRNLKGQSSVINWQQQLIKSESDSLKNCNYNNLIFSQNRDKKSNLTEIKIEQA